RSQNLANALVTQNFPRVTLTPAPVNIGQAITWSPQFSYNNNQTFHSPAAQLLIPGAAGPDTLAGFFNNRQSDLSFATPLRIGRWNWSNQLSVSDRASNQRTEFIFPDPTDPTGIRRVLYVRAGVAGRLHFRSRDRPRRHQLQGAQRPPADDHRLVVAELRGQAQATPGRYYRPCTAQDSLARHHHDRGVVQLRAGEAARFHGL